MTLTENFGAYQYEIYLQGMGGQTPDLPIDFAALEQLAQQRMTPEAWGYVAGGATSEDTARANLDAFRRWRLAPRMLNDISSRDTRVTVCGTDLLAPVLLAPIGVQSIIHPEGERAVARAAAAANVAMCLSTASSFTLEEVAEDLGDTPRWFQLYWPSDDELTVSLLDRAEAAGYSAIVVTLDTTMLAWRPRDLDTAYLPFLNSIGIANYLADPVFRSRLEQSPEDDPQAAVMQFVQVFSDPSNTWQRLELLREHTDLPLVLKGIQRTDDARRAAEHGADGVIVSNHGGRQVDGAVASLDALPSVVEAVGDDLDVLFDSGVRTGSDALKALALGADAVLLGRPYTWGLGAAGEEGVRHVLRAFLADLDLNLALSGHASITELTRDSLVAG